MEDIILHNPLCPGDILVSTMSIASLMMTYPNRYRIGVKNCCPAIFENSPHITPISELNNPKIITQEYSLINECNSRPISFGAAYCHDLGQKLGVRLECLVNKPVLTLSDDEKGWIPRIQEIFGDRRPYVVCAASWKNDFPTKRWYSAYWNEVVDRLKDRLTFIQVGEKHHNHFEIPGAVNEIGNTDARQLIRLCYHSEMGIGPSTFIQWIFAALERPYIMIQSREPMAWCSFPPTQISLTCLGQLPCCQKGSCWKGKFDGDDGVCERPHKKVSVDGTEEWVSECQLRISPDIVIRHIERMIQSGVIRSNDVPIA